jgi:hypothetical protein
MMPLERKLAQDNDVQKTRKRLGTCVAWGLMRDVGITNTQFLAAEEIREKVVCNLLKNNNVCGSLSRE